MKIDFKKISFLIRRPYHDGRSEEDIVMSFQNPVFIPGPTNIPENLRKACDMPTIDHRSPLFGSILHPALDGVRKVLKSDSPRSLSFPPPAPAAGKPR